VKIINKTELKWKILKFVNKIRNLNEKPELKRPKMAHLAPAQAARPEGPARPTDNAPKNSPARPAGARLARRLSSARLTEAAAQASARLTGLA
jgi:hypothetical protein